MSDFLKNWHNLLTQNNLSETNLLILLIGSFLVLLLTMREFFAWLFKSYKISTEIKKLGTQIEKLEGQITDLQETLKSQGTNNSTPSTKSESTFPINH